GRRCPARAGRRAHRSVEARLARRSDGFLHSFTKGVCLGTLGPQSYTQDMAVSRRTVTVLFADVADSTPLGERLDPESLRRVMSRFFEEMSVVLLRHGGTVEKFIGDAVAAWNVLGVSEGASAYARRLDAPLIGREPQLEALRAAYDAAIATRTCRLFTVVGPAGIGKSRLAAELCGSLREEATTLTGR